MQQGVRHLPDYLSGIHIYLGDAQGRDARGPAQGEFRPQIGVVPGPQACDRARQRYGYGGIGGIDGALGEETAVHSFLLRKTKGQVHLVGGHAPYPDGILGVHRHALVLPQPGGIVGIIPAQVESYLSVQPHGKLVLVFPGEGRHHTEAVVVAASEDGGEDVPLPYGIRGGAAQLEDVVLRGQGQLAFGDTAEEMFPGRSALEGLIP